MSNDSLKAIVDQHFPLVLAQFQLYAAAAQDSSDLQTPESLETFKQEHAKLNQAHDQFQADFIAAGGTQTQANTMLHERYIQHMSGQTQNPQP